MEDITVGQDINHLDEDITSVLNKAKLVRAQAASEIAADIRKMVNNADYSDVVFLCKDGARVHACRMFLVARNEVFQRMLLNGMAESRLAEIPLREIPSTALIPVMEFLYTGTLQEHMPKEWRIAYSIIGAARFFLLEKLELIAVEYLMLTAAKVGVSIINAAKFLCIAVEFVGMFGETVDLNARNLACKLESTSLGPEHLRALTDKAFLYFLETTKYDNEEPELLLNAEFLRLKNIILWCACKQFAPKKNPRSSHAVLPEIESIVKLLDESQFHDRPCRPSETYIGIKSALALSVKDHLSLVSFRKVSPKLLVNIIEPMDLVPASVMMDAFRFQAFRTSDSYVIVDNLNWSTNCKNREIYRTSRDGSVIEQVLSGSGFARYGFAIHHTGRDKMFMWEITIEKFCFEFIEIGLHHNLDGNFDPKNGQTLSEQPGGWALRMDSQGLSINRQGKHRVDRGDPKFVSSRKDYSQLVYGKDYGQKNSKVEVCFDSWNKTCTFTVDDDDEFGGSAWVDIPHGDLHPAVSLGCRRGGRVRIKIL